MKISLITPAGPKSRYGNRRTAERWASFLRDLGHEVTVEETWNGEPAEVMIALHARRSHDSIARYAATHPDHPLIVALTGTDLYRDIHQDADARKSLDVATRLIVLQDAGLMELDPRHRKKARVVYQSAEQICRQPPEETSFDVCVIGHLRAEKDPFRTALASQLLPPSSRVRVIHAGGARDGALAAEAQAHMRENPRYQWLGEVSREKVRVLLSRARLLVQSSLMEGGANAVSEALAAGLPVIASDIPGNVGMLGEDYPGYYPPGDERALARLLERTEQDPDFYELLEAKCRARRHLTRPGNEREALRAVIQEFRVR
ncbi:MAG TPA: selenoneine biosynthesis selenosugar synthase SenB [Rubrobacteraceae bacterium]|nr:selenoneine biosynthesis selenosugar synthase SenB [Rubrobacteraceae bacterium]